MASTINPYPTRGGELLTLNTTQQDIKQKTIKVYTATEDCRIDMIADIYGNLYIKLDDTASASNYDVYISPDGIPSEGTQYKYDFTLGRNLATFAVSNIVYSRVQLDLNKGEYISIYTNNSNQYRPGKLFAYGVRSR